jgi:hypothetical protein
MAGHVTPGDGCDPVVSINSCVASMAGNRIPKLQQGHASREVYTLRSIGGHIRSQGRCHQSQLTLK